MGKRFSSDTLEGKPLLCKGLQENVLKTLVHLGTQKALAFSSIRTVPQKL